MWNQGDQKREKYVATSIALFGPRQNLSCESGQVLPQILAAGLLAAVEGGR